MEVTPSNSSAAETRAFLSGSSCNRLLQLNLRLSAYTGAQYTLTLMRMAAGRPTYTRTSVGGDRLYVRFQVRVPANTAFRVTWSYSSSAPQPLWFGVAYADDSPGSRLSCTGAVRLFFEENGFHFTRFAQNRHPRGYEAPCPASGFSVPGSQPCF